jgi:hypothetical protein
LTVLHERQLFAPVAEHVKQGTVQTMHDPLQIHSDPTNEYPFAVLQAVQLFVPAAEQFKQGDEQARQDDPDK